MAVLEEVGVLVAVDVCGELTGVRGVDGVTALGLKTWKALPLAPGLLREEKGREEDGDDKGGAKGMKPPGSAAGAADNGDPISAFGVTGDWVQVAKAAWVCRGESMGEIMGGGV